MERDSESVYQLRGDRERERERRSKSVYQLRGDRERERQ